RVLFRDVEARRAVNELELLDDAAGPCHRDVHDLRRADGTDRPWTAYRYVIDSERTVRGDTEVRPRTHPHGIHRDGLGARVAKLVHEIGERLVVERAIDAHADPLPLHRRTRGEDAQLIELTLRLGKRPLAARRIFARLLGPESQVEDLLSQSVVPLGEVRDERGERRGRLELQAARVHILCADLRHGEDAEEEGDDRRRDAARVRPHYCGDPYLMLRAPPYAGTFSDAARVTRKPSPYTS